MAALLPYFSISHYVNTNRLRGGGSLVKFVTERGNMTKKVNYTVVWEPLCLSGFIDDSVLAFTFPHKDGNEFANTCT